MLFLQRLFNYIIYFVQPTLEESPVSFYIINVVYVISPREGKKKDQINALLAILRSFPLEGRKPFAITNISFEKKTTEAPRWKFN